MMEVEIVVLALVAGGMTWGPKDSRSRICGYSIGLKLSVDLVKELAVVGGELALGIQRR